MEPLHSVPSVGQLQGLFLYRPAAATSPAAAANLLAFRATPDGPPYDHQGPLLAGMTALTRTTAFREPLASSAARSVRPTPASIRLTGTPDGSLRPARRDGNRPGRVFRNRVSGTLRVG